MPAQVLADGLVTHTDAAEQPPANAVPLLSRGVLEVQVSWVWEPAWGTKQVSVPGPVNQPSEREQLGTMPQPGAEVQAEAWSREWPPLDLMRLIISFTAPQVVRRVGS